MPRFRIIQKIIQTLASPSLVYLAYLLERYPIPSLVAKEDIYQAFGVGGRFAPANDGTDLYPDAPPVVVPHYSAMIASLRPEQSIGMWNWLITNGFFSPLMNTESLMFPADSSCDAANVKFNHLKGS